MKYKYEIVLLKRKLICSVNNFLADNSLQKYFTMHVNGEHYRNIILFKQSAPALPTYEGMLYIMKPF